MAVEVTFPKTAVRPAIPLLRQSTAPALSRVQGMYEVPESSIHPSSVRGLTSILQLTIPARGFRQEETYPVWQSVEDEQLGTVMLVPRAFGLAQFGQPIKDCRVEGTSITGSFSGTLYDWQEQVVDGVVSALRTGSFNGGVLQADCGLGKTMMGIAIALRLGVRAAVCVNKEFLMSQWRARIEAFTVDVSLGLVQGSNFQIGDITLAMIQTVSMDKYRPDDFDSIGLLIVDEVHHIPAKTYWRLMRFFRAKYLLGLTATPERGDGNQHAIHWAFGPKICVCRRQEQNASCTLVQLETQCGPPVNVEKSGRLDWTRLISMLVADTRRNSILSAKIKAEAEKGHHVLVISERVKHLHELQGEVGDGCMYTGGYTTAQKRKREEEFAQKPSVVFTTKAMAAEGFDWTDCNMVVFATPFTTGPNLQQACGRCSRSTSAHERFLVDFVDKTPALQQLAVTRQRFLREKKICK